MSRFPVYNLDRSIFFRSYINGHGPKLGTPIFGLLTLLNIDLNLWSPQAFNFDPYPIEYIYICMSYLNIIYIYIQNCINMRVRLLLI
jgi:hypothetical protein